MVAKSYQKLKQIGSPYTKNGKQYVSVLNEETGSRREVRWYTEEEYIKLYGALPVVYSNSKEEFGFDNGFITIFRGDTYANLEWFRASIAKYNKLWGWYVVSTEAVPFDLPVGLEPIELLWELVGNEDGSLKSEVEIKRGVESVLYEESDSKFVGNIGDKLELEVEVIAARQMDGYYGRTTVHHMIDSDGNVYLWNTAAKNWEVGEKHHIKCSIKDHKVIKNVNTTILTRCMEIK